MQLVSREVEMPLRGCLWREPAPRMLPLWSRVLAVSSSLLCGAMLYHAAFTVLDMFTSANCDSASA